MKATKILPLITILTLVVTIVAACGAPATEPSPTEAPPQAPTKAPPATAAPELGTVVIGINAEYPPFEFVDEAGDIVGFDPELMTAIAEAAGFEFEFVNTRWDGIFVALASGEFDAVISAATITDERKETVDFSDPYFEAGQMIAVQASNTDIATADDLAGKKVGVQLGTTGDIWLTDETEAEVVRYDENTLAFQALGNGDVDAAMADGPTLIDIVQANPELKLKVLDGVYTEENYGIAVRKERKDVLAVINEGLAAVKSSGEYDEVYDKYFGIEEPEVVELGEIVVGINAEYPPFEFVDEAGDIVGFDPELMTAIAEAAGFEFKFVNTRWDGIFVALASGEFDCVISAATITEERAETVDFSNPYFEAGQMIAVQASNTDILTADDLAGKKVGVQLGTTGDIWLTDETGAEVVRYDENTLAFQALGNGDVDAAMADGPTLIDIVQANPELKLKVLDGVYTEENYGIAVHKERKDLLEALNEGLAAVRISGKYDEIYEKYFGITADLGKIIIGINAEYPPFEFVDEAGDIVGFDPELMTAIAEAAGFEFEFVNTRWDGIFVALASGEFDCVISAATITEERAETVDFSDPYFEAGQMITVRADETDIASADDLAGKRVGVQLGTTGDIWLTDETGAEVVRYDENTLAFQALSNGDVDAAVADGPTGIEIVQANPEMNLKVLDGVYTDENYGIAVHKERTDLLAALNEGLAAVKASGKYDEIYAKYFSTD